jgi:hypothetical protein
MADKKISALTASTTPLAGTEVLPIVQGGSTVKVSVANLTAGRDTSVKDLNASGNVVSKGTAVFFGDGLDNSAYVYATGGPVHIFANAAATFDFTTAGNLKPLIADKGIDFSANTNAPGMTSEVLSDYEEGTFTPVVADAATGGNVAASATTSGVYTKIGNVVTVHFQASSINTTGMTAGNALFLRGLPYTNNASQVANGVVDMRNTVFTDYPTVFLNTSAAACMLFMHTSGAGVAQILVSGVTGTSIFNVSLTYTV